MEAWDIILIVVPASASAYVTSLLCRTAIRRGRQAHWHFALLGISGGGAFTMLFIWCGFSLQNGHLPYAGLIWIALLKLLTPFAILTPLLVTWILRTRNRVGKLNVPAEE